MVAAILVDPCLLGRCQGRVVQGLRAGEGGAAPWLALVVIDEVFEVLFVERVLEELL